MRLKADRNRCPCHANLNARITFSLTLVDWCSVLRSIVQPLVLSMLDTGHDLSLRRAVVLQLVGDDHSWDVLQTLQQRGV